MYMSEQSEAEQAEIHLLRVCCFLEDRLRMLAVELGGREFLHSKVSAGVGAIDDVDPLKDHELYFRYAVNEFDAAIDLGRFAYRSDEAAVVFDRAQPSRDRLHSILDLFLPHHSPTPEVFEECRTKVLKETRSLLEHGFPLMYDKFRTSQEHIDSPMLMNIEKLPYTGEEPLDPFAKADNPVLLQVLHQDPPNLEVLMKGISQVRDRDTVLYKRLNTSLSLARPYKRPASENDNESLNTLVQCRSGRAVSCRYMHYQRLFLSCHGQLDEAVVTVVQNVLLYMLKQMEWIGKRDPLLRDDLYFKSYFSTLRRYNDVCGRRLLYRGKWVRVKSGSPSLKKSKPCVDKESVSMKETCFDRPPSEPESTCSPTKPGCTEDGPDLDKALVRDREYLADFRSQLARFQELLPELRRTYLGRFVALSAGQIIDQDESEGSLAARVHNAHKEGVVLIQRVENAEPQLVEISSRG